MSTNSTPEIIIRGGDHEHTLGIAGDRGGVRLGYETMRLQDIFVAMLETRCFEVCEFSLANYIVLRASGQHWLTAIPVFPFRAFRHGGAITRRDSTLTDLSQLACKRVGVEDYSMTAAVWFRSLLREEYGVDYRSITWVSYHQQRLPLPSDAKVEFTSNDLEGSLLDGGIDAMLAFAIRDARLPPSQRRLRTVVADPEVVERDYYRRTGIYPINHCIVIRNDALEHIPALSAVVFEAYASTKARAYQRQLGSTLMPWAKLHWAQTFELFDNDPLPYGLTPQNLQVVERLAQALHEQGFITNVPDIERLFIHP